MRWIGLTGGIATGKSTVSRILRSRGIAVVDADQLAREAVQVGTPGHTEVIQAFGQDVVSPTGELDRKKIGLIVFSDPARLLVLESIIHPRVRQLAMQKRRELEAAGHSVAFYDVPLLFEKKMQPMFDLIVTVACPPEMQLQRLIARDGLTEDEAARRISVQIPITEKAKLSDHVIDNSSDIDSLEKGVDRLLTLLHQAQT